MLYFNSHGNRLNTVSSASVQRSGNIRPRGLSDLLLRDISRSVLIPDPLRYSHWHLVPLKPDVFAGDQGSVATERGALREDLLAVLTGPTSAMNIAQAL